MTTEEFIKEVNQEREEEAHMIRFSDNMKLAMKYTKETYDAALYCGFSEDKAMSLAYGYFYNLWYPTMNKDK